MSDIEDFVQPALAAAAIILALALMFWVIGTVAQEGGPSEDQQMFEQCIAAGGSWYDDSMGGGTVECRNPAAPQM